MANIRVDANFIIKDGSEIVFKAPCDCSNVTGLVIYYPDADGNETSHEFQLADAHNNDVGNINELFADGAVVKVILDVTNGRAYVQNADTNAYLEGRLDSKMEFVQYFAPPLPSGIEWKSVIAADGDLVALATNGTIAKYSANNHKWSKQAIGIDAEWVSLTYDTTNKTFAALAKDGMFAYGGLSTWVTGRMSDNVEWSDIAYGGGLLVAIANNTEFMAVSTNGTTWRRYYMPTSAKWKSVIYGTDKFVAIASTGEIAYSEAGIQWSIVNSATGCELVNLVFGNGTFIIAGNDCEARSTDGINWTISRKSKKITVRTAVYGNGRFIILTNEAVKGRYSEDGIIWRSITCTADVAWISAAYCGTSFVAIAADGTTMFSDDGITWCAEDTSTIKQNGVDITEQLKELFSGASDEQIRASIEVYLEENPVNSPTDAQVATAVKEYMDENPVDTGVQFETDDTLTLEDGVLSVKTTDKMEQDNTLPMTSGGIYTVVGNIEALLKTI